MLPRVATANDCRVDRTESIKTTTAQVKAGERILRLGLVKAREHRPQSGVHFEWPCCQSIRPPSKQSQTSGLIEKILKGKSPLNMILHSPLYSCRLGDEQLTVVLLIYCEMLWTNRWSGRVSCALNAFKLLSWEDGPQDAVGFAAAASGDRFRKTALCFVASGSKRAGNKIPFICVSIPHSRD